MDQKDDTVQLASWSFNLVNKIFSKVFTTLVPLLAHHVKKSECDVSLLGKL